MGMELALKLAGIIPVNCYILKKVQYHVVYGIFR